MNNQDWHWSRCLPVDSRARGNYAFLERSIYGWSTNAEIRDPKFYLDDYRLKWDDHIHLLNGLLATNLLSYAFRPDAGQPGCFIGSINMVDCAYLGLIVEL